MSIAQRRYKLLTDFPKVHDFLTETYDPITLNSYLLPQYFEYAHVLPWFFNYSMSHRFGIWEDDGAIVGIACYEMDLGDCCHLHVRKGYEELLPELLNWAEKELSSYKDGNRQLKIWITDKEPHKRELLKASGYVLDRINYIKTFDYSKDFPKRKLPDGFALIDGTDINYNKLDICWWKGFDHEGDPDGSLDYRIHMCNAPNFRPELMTIAVAPDGEYACALGMWFDEYNKYAYLEPMATIPKYRRMGLGTVALTEAMQKTKALGAEYCFGGGREFYSDIGFETKCNWELWRKDYND